MTDNNIYKDISERTGGAVMLGVVGPVRTGKSTFIKRFMEELVIPNIDDAYARERAIDELPQSGSGRTIMTSEPKFIPEEAVSLKFNDGTHFDVRLVDCVGYMVSGAAGQLENGVERMVATPWFDDEISMTQAAEEGTRRVITDHSTVGLVITTDGSICGIPREDYVEPERRVINELKAIGKPFAVIINSAYPESDDAQRLQSELSESYGVPCITVNCQNLSEEQIGGILRSIIGEFPIADVKISLPEWFSALGDENELKSTLYALIVDSLDDIRRLNDIDTLAEKLDNSEIIDGVLMSDCDMGLGNVNIELKMPRELYYSSISRETGFNIGSDSELICILRQMSEMKQDYDNIKDALTAVRETGYGVVMPPASELSIDEPKIVRQNGKYSVKLNARAEAIHMLKTGVQAEISPSICGENASDEIIGFLLQGYEGDMSKLWDSNIFGRPLYDIAQEGIAEKLASLPENARIKLQETLQRIINEGRGTLFCILL